MRFTNRYSNGKPFIMNCALQSTNGIEDAIEKLAYYEDMEEQGRLVIYDEETVLAMVKANAKVEEDKLELLRIIDRLAAQQSTIHVNV